MKPEQLSQIELKRAVLNCTIGKSCLNMEPDHSPPDGVSYQLAVNAIVKHGEFSENACLKALSNIEDFKSLAHKVYNELEVTL